MVNEQPPARSPEPHAALQMSVVRLPVRSSATDSQLAVASQLDLFASVATLQLASDALSTETLAPQPSAGDSAFPRLTPRQRQLLALVADGLVSSQQLSEHLGLRPATIDNHLSNVVKLVGVKNRLQAAELFVAFQQSHDRCHDRSTQGRRRPVQTDLDVPRTSEAQQQDVYRSILVAGLGCGGESVFSHADLFGRLVRITIIGGGSIGALTLLMLGLYATVT